MTEGDQSIWEIIVKNSYQNDFVTEDKIVRLPLARSFGKYDLYFTKESYDHPATMNIELAEWVILNYTEENWQMLDPMCGVGVVPIVAALNKRHCIAVDIESEFLTEVVRNYQNIRDCSLGDCGIVQAFQADSRELKNFKDWQSSFDFIFFSPPYLPDKVGRQKNRYEQDKERGYDFGRGMFRYHYSDNPLNIGNARPYEEYKDMMLQVYSSCYDVLKTGHKMALITKNGVRKGETVWLDRDTIELCERAGFKFVDRRWFEVQGPSFFVVQNVKQWCSKHETETRHPYSVYEDILFLQK